MGAPEPGSTHRAPRRPDSLVVVGDTVHLVGEVHEWECRPGICCKRCIGSSGVVGLPIAWRILVHGVGGESVSAPSATGEAPCCSPNLIKPYSPPSTVEPRRTRSSIKNRCRNPEKAIFGSIQASVSQPWLHIRIRQGGFKPISAWVPPRSIHHSLWR